MLIFKQEDNSFIKEEDGTVHLPIALQRNEHSTTLIVLSFRFISGRDRIKSFTSKYALRDESHYRRSFQTDTEIAVRDGDFFGIATEYLTDRVKKAIVEEHVNKKVLQRMDSHRNGALFVSDDQEVNSVIFSRHYKPYHNSLPINANMVFCMNGDYVTRERLKVGFLYRWERGVPHRKDVEYLVPIALVKRIYRYFVNNYDKPAIIETDDWSKLDKERIAIEKQVKTLSVVDILEKVVADEYKKGRINK
jgi:hypothetical protein